MTVVMGALKVLFRMVRWLFRWASAPHESVELGGHYPEPWLIRGRPFRQFWWRFWLGRPMDNEIRTNATFWRSATTGYPSRWLRLAGWQRLALRLIGAWSVLVVLPLLTWQVVSIWAAPLRSGAGALTCAASMLPLMLTVGALTLRRLIRERGLVLPRWERVERADDAPERSRFYERWRFAPLRVLEGSRTWEREVVLPLARALAPQLNRAWHPDTATQWCIVPRNYAQAGGSPVEIRVPAGFTGADYHAINRIVRTVAAKLSLKELTPTLQLSGEHPRILLSAPEAPPEKLGYADVAHFLERSEEYRPFFGVAAGGSALNVEMIEDSPHIALSAGPGAGKTTLAALIAAQALGWGWGVVILDWKQSESWGPVKSMPGVRYISELEEIHDFGEHLISEIDTRKRNGLAGRKKLLVIRDEWNATADLLMDYWQTLRSTEPDPEVKKSMSLKSPALRGFAQLDFAGREWWLHDLVIAQRLSARVFNGNADARTCFGIRGAARYDEPMKKMLFGNMKPFPKKSNHPGRWTVVAGEDVSVVQVPLLTAEELLTVATGVRTAVSDPDPTPLETDSTQGFGLGHDPGSAVQVDTCVRELTAGTVRLVGLSTLAVQLADHGVTKEVLRNERKRDVSFPQSRGGDETSGYLYDLDEVTKWARRRQARMAVER